jgi:ADP-ribosylglycohydrolase
MKTLNHDKIMGCIVGGAIGDVLGGVTERNQLSISDDTQLTLATCEAIIAKGKVLPDAVAAAFLRWFKAGKVTGVGSSTLKALRDLAAGAHWALAGAKGERTAGNGAAMRIAPLAFALAPYDKSYRVIVRDVSRITHHNDEAYLGALTILLAIRANTLTPDPSFFDSLFANLPDCRVRDRLIEFSDLHSDTPIQQVAAKYGTSGYVVETVPLALYAACRMTPENFEKTMNELIEVGGDTDTTCAIAGQIAGAHLGYSNLPENLLALGPVNEVIAPAENFARAILEINT